MKKIVTLTSLLALCACGGGGGGSNASADRARPFDSERIVSNQTYNSNQKVTSMVSRILVSQDGQHTLARTATTTLDGVNYDTYDLSNVTFAIADEGFDADGMRLVVDADTGEIIALDMGFGTEPGYPTTYKFVRDENGKIIDLDLDAEDADEHPEKYLYRTANTTNEFIGFVNHDDGEDEEEEEIGEGEGEHDGANWVETTVKYNSLGNSAKLRYSDFGNIDVGNTLPGWLAMFIGGYEAKRIDPAAVDSTKTFNGHATGSVIALRNNQEGKAIELDDTNAKLTFDKTTGTSTMTATFGNWYNVAYTENHGTNAKSITYSDYTYQPDADEIAGMSDEQIATATNYFRMLSDTMDDEFTMNAVENHEQHGSEVETFDSIQSDLRFYGDNSIASESIGLIQVRDCAGGQCGEVMGERSDEIRMNLGFGGKHDVPTTNPRRD